MAAGKSSRINRQYKTKYRIDPEGRRFRYVLLATSRTGTLESELNELPPGFSFVGMTVFNSRFGGDETASILEAVITE